MGPLSAAELCRLEVVANQSAFAAGLNEVWADTYACTAFLTDALELAAQGFGATVCREFVLGVLCQRTRTGKQRERTGHLDLLAEFKDGSFLAIEIDRTHKPFSLTKLRLAKASGMTELWVRWDGPHSRDREVMVLNIDPPSRVETAFGGRKVQWPTEDMPTNLTTKP